MATYKVYELLDTTINEKVRSPVLSWDELIEYLEKNPHLELPSNDKISDLGGPGLHSGRPMSVYKTDGAFKEKLQNLKRFYPHNNINV